MKKDELWKDEASKMVNHFWNRMPIFRNTARIKSSNTWSPGSSSFLLATKRNQCLKQRKEKQRKDHENEGDRRLVGCVFGRENLM